MYDVYTCTNFFTVSGLWNQQQVCPHVTEIKEHCLVMINEGDVVPMGKWSKPDAQFGTNQNTQEIEVSFDLAHPPSEKP